MGPLSQYVRNWPCASLQRNQLSRKSQDHDFFGISVELVIPTDVELSDWRGLGGCFHPISVRVFCSGIIYLAVRNKAVISASAADNTTYFIIWAMVRRSPFQRGMESFSDKKMWAPARLLDFVSLEKPASECAARIMLLDRQRMPSSGYVAQ